MAEYRVGVCDTCGSEDKFLWRCPDGWYDGGNITIQTGLNDIYNISDSIGLRCSKDCLKVFIGSYFIAAEKAYIKQIDDLGCN